MRKRNTLWLLISAVLLLPTAAFAEGKVPANNGESAPMLPEISVTAKHEEETGYSRYSTTTATKTDTPIMETPVSIQVVPRELMNDQQAVDAREVLRNISGVQQSTSPSNYENYVIRGFDASASVYRNGLRQDAFAEETSQLDRIEVLKGPAAVLYGRIEPGGLINLQSLQPLDRPYYSLQQQVGSYDFYRTTLDATGPINADRSLLYRFNFAYRNSGSYRDFVNLDRLFFNPQMTWRISPRTVVNIGLELQRDNYRSDYGFPAVNNRPLRAPINRSLMDPAVYDTQESQRVFLNWSHAFNNDWKLTNRFMLGYTDYEQFDIFPVEPAPGATTVNRFLWGVHQDRDVYSTNLDLTGKFTTWGVKHAVLFGFDYFNFEQKALGHCCDLPGPAATLDLLNPVYGLTTTDFIKSQPQDFFFYRNQDWKGVYFQDQITLWDKLHILGGGRYDWMGYGSASGASIGAAEKNADARKLHQDYFSPRVGILYRPWNWFSVYGNYTQSVGANNGRTAGNRPLDPQTAQQYEFGFKTSFFEDRLTSTLAFFHITKQHLSVPDLSTPDPTDSTTLGEARSQGIEFDLSGQLTEAWSLIASYAYTDTAITKDVSCLQTDPVTLACLQPGGGNTHHRLPNAALHSGSLWSKYDFTHGFLKGLSLGTGVYIASQRQGDVANSFQLPGYVRWDAFAAYRWMLGKTRLTAQVNVKNLLDKRYFTGADTIDGSPRDYGNIPGAPLTVLGSLRVEY